MSEIEFLCRNRSTMEMGFIMRQLLDKALLEKSDLSELNALLTENSDIDIFGWISLQEDPPAKYLDIITVMRNMIQE